MLGQAALPLLALGSHSVPVPLFHSAVFWTIIICPYLCLFHNSQSFGRGGTWGGMLGLIE